MIIWILNKVNPLPKTKKMGAINVLENFIKAEII